MKCQICKMGFRGKTNNYYPKLCRDCAVLSYYLFEMRQVPYATFNMEKIKGEHLFAKQ